MNPAGRTQELRARLSCLSPTASWALGRKKPDSSLAPPQNGLEIHWRLFPHRERVRPQQAVWGHKSGDQEDLYTPIDLQGSPIPLLDDGGRGAQHRHGTSERRVQKLLTVNAVEGMGLSHHQGRREETTCSGVQGRSSRQGVPSRSPYPEESFGPLRVK